MNVWFNRTFSSIHSALRLIREADVGERFKLIASGRNPHALARQYADDFFLEPKGLTAGEYLDWCHSACMGRDIAVFVPGREARLIAEHAGAFAEAGTLVMSAAAPEVLERLHDKARFYAELACPEAPAPALRAFETRADFEDAHEALASEHAELCIKPAVSVYGIGFRRIRTDRSAYEILAGGLEYQIDLASLRALLAEQERIATMLLMEYLPGPEYSVDCLADYGMLRCAIARRKSLAAGEGQIIDGRADIQAACKRIVSQFALNGYINIQFREGTSGLRTLEVNPRLSGGVAMACLAGPNLPYLGLRGFAEGYHELSIAPVEHGLRVGEANLAVRLP